MGDRDVLHVCFCGWDRVEDGGTKICVNVAYPQTDQGYMDQVRASFLPRVREFEPALILHNLGHDTCQMDYGDLGLTPDFFLGLVREVKAWAREVCGGRYVVLTHGGRRAEVAEYIFPGIIEILAEE
jgi:acetoin utilization deacetylase AcuC-like enzyme